MAGRLQPLGRVGGVVRRARCILAEPAEVSPTASRVVLPRSHPGRLARSHGKGSIEYAVSPPGPEKTLAPSCSCHEEIHRLQGWTTGPAAPPSGTLGPGVSRTPDAARNAPVGTARSEIHRFDHARRQRETPEAPRHATSLAPIVTGFFATSWAYRPTATGVSPTAWWRCG